MFFCVFFCGTDDDKVCRENMSRTHCMGEKLRISFQMESVRDLLAAGSGRKARPLHACNTDGYKWPGDNKSADLTKKPIALGEAVTNGRVRLPFSVIRRHGFAVFVPRHRRLGMSFGRIAFHDGRVSRRGAHVFGQCSEVLLQVCQTNGKYEIRNTFSAHTCKRDA